ncbi:hypothetical protein [Streptomyces sp. NPDC053048]|uniref:hypothetical protein n=1 Tax=Streptomyces sp. NPDC053048 TaxID=3365694 RepID=UPI0037CD10C7
MTMRPEAGGAAAPPHQWNAPEVSALLGTWHNTERDGAGGLLRITVTECEGTKSEGAVRVRVLGSGDPEPVDWGEAEAVTYTPPDAPSAAVALTAAYDSGFLRTVVSAYVKAGILVATTYNVFTDDSGRANYWTREFYYRQGEQQ